MAVLDHAKATEYLARIGYYQLSAFWYQFRDTIPGTASLQLGDQFKPGTTFKTAVDLYAFDKGLRSQVIDVVERIEIAMRTQIALQLGQFDPRAHRNTRLLNSRFTAKNPATGLSPHDKWLGKLDEKAATSKEEFADHFRTKYAGDTMPI